MFENFLSKITSASGFQPLIHTCAAKFTREGTITVSGGLSDNGEHIYLAVEDTGDGIPKARLGQIFKESLDKVRDVLDVWICV